MTRDQVRARIEEIGIIPAIRVVSPEDALFAAQTVSGAGIPIVEVTMTVPGAVDVIATMVREIPDLIVGAGTVFDAETARACVKAGAHFLTSTGFDRELVSLAIGEGVVAMPGVLTPSEVLMAWRAGADLLKVFPCAQVGGPAYIRALKAPFPLVPLVASGGVTQQNAAEFIMAGATALGIGGHLIPREAIESRHTDRIRELARRFLVMVRQARAAKADK